MRKETYDRLYYSDSSPEKDREARVAELEKSWYEFHQEFSRARGDAYCIRVDDPSSDLQNHLKFSVVHIFLTLGVGSLLFPLVGPAALLYMVFIGTWLHSLAWIKYKRKQRARIVDLRNTDITDPKDMREFIDLVNSNK